MGDDDLKARVDAHEARLKRHSDNVKGVRKSVTDVEETWDDFQRAVMAHVRRIEAQNTTQERLLGRVKWWCALAVVLVSTAAEIYRSVAAPHPQRLEQLERNR